MRFKVGDQFWHIRRDGQGRAPKWREIVSITDGICSFKWSDGKDSFIHLSEGALEQALEAGWIERKENKQETLKTFKRLYDKVQVL